MLRRNLAFALMGRVRQRIGDKRVLALVKAFLKAGILGEDGRLTDTSAGSPQGSILSPLLSNVALSVLDEHIAQGGGRTRSKPYERAKRRRQGLPNYRLVPVCGRLVPAGVGTKATQKRSGGDRRRSCRRWACACRRKRP